MLLTPGTRLGPYEILAPLGAGGMGEVFRARDTRLGRDVAVKVLPHHLSDNPEVRARFEREAKTISSLNHPHICTLFDVGREADTDYLVMELVEGETLARRLGKGALPAADVLRLGGQIADALDRAHRAGVIHRDLKPGNVMLTRSGAKLMDFGLARVTGMAGSEPGSGETAAALTRSPTEAAPLTAEGTIVGTFQYMAPEQLEGKEADARSDLWALGCVLYEMATGRRAFEGKSQASLIGSIMEREPTPVSELAPLAPPALDRLVQGCLAKHPEDRLQSAHDIRMQLAWLAEAGSQAGVAAQGTAQGTPETSSPHHTMAWVWLLAAVALVALVAGAMGGVWVGGSREAAMRAVTRLSVLPPGPGKHFGALASYALSPNGRKLAFTLVDGSDIKRLYVRDLADDRARLLPGTEGASWPFWSPDSRDLGFFASGYVCRVPASGGAVRRICPAADGRGGSWGTRGAIVFSPDPSAGIWVVNAAGGTPRQVTWPDSAKGESSHRWPAFLPDGRHFLFAVNGVVSAVNAPIEIAATDDPSRHRICESPTAASFAAPDRIVFTHDQALLSQRLDMRRWKLLGEPTLLRDQPRNIGRIQLMPSVSCSATGVMAFTPNDARPTDVVETGPGGEQRVIARFPVPVYGTSLSPDGKWVAVSNALAQGWSTYVLDLTTGVASQVAEMGRGLYDPTWSPEGRRLVGATMGGIRQIDVTSGAESSFVSAGPAWSPIGGWTPDGRELVIYRQVSGHGYDIMQLPLDPPGPPRPWLATSANERSCALSHDGRLLVYISDALGPANLFVDTYPARTGAARCTQVGVRNADVKPVWSADDREVYYVDPDNRLVAIPVTHGAHPGFGTPRRLANLPSEATGWLVTTEGRYLFLVPHGESQPSIMLVDGWMREAAISR